MDAPESEMLSESGESHCQGVLPARLRRRSAAPGVASAATTLLGVHGDSSWTAPAATSGLHIARP